MEVGLTDKMINWLLTRKVVAGRPWVVSFMLMFAAYAASLLVNMVVPCIVLWSIMVDLFEKVGYKQGDKWPSIMMFSVLLTSSVAAMVAPFQIGVVANFGMLTAASGGTLQLNFVNYFIWASVIGVLLFAVWFVYAKYVLRPDVEPLKAQGLFQEDGVPLSKLQKIVIALFLVFIVGLFLPSLLPAGNPVRELLDAMGNAGWGLLIVIIALVVRVNDKVPFDFKDMFAKGIVWEIVMMMACIMTIAGQLASPETGLPAIASDLIMHIVGAMGEVPFVLLMSLIILIVGNLTNNVAVSAVFIPVLYTISIDTGMNAIMFTAIINFLGNIVLLSPACSPNAAMMYGQSDWIGKGNCVKYAVFTMIAVYVVSVFVGVPLANMLMPMP